MKVKLTMGYFADKEEQNPDSEWEKEVDETELDAGVAKGLRLLRKYYGYTLKKVSEGTNIPFQTIARYESGENTPSIVQAYKLAYFYKFPLSDIFCIGLDNDDTEDDIMYILQNNYNLGNDDNE